MMSKPEFSPGPWTIEHVIDDEGDHIWWVNTQFGEPAAAKCFDPYNAQLISAAPDLWNALRQCRNYLVDLNCDANDLVALADKALAKAEGKEEA